MVERHLLVAELHGLVQALARRFLLPQATEAPLNELTRAEILVVDVLGRGPQSMTTLARECGTPLTTMTSLVDRLVAKGFVRRTRSHSDRRLVLAALTPKGRQAQQQSLEGSLSLCLASVDALDGREQAQLLGILRKIGDALEKPRRASEGAGTPLRPRDEIRNGP